MWHRLHSKAVQYKLESIHFVTCRIIVKVVVLKLKVVTGLLLTHGVWQGDSMESMFVGGMRCICPKLATVTSTALSG